MISEIFFQRKARSYLFSKACWLFSQKIYFLFVCFFFLTACKLDTVDARDHIFFLKKACERKCTRPTHFFEVFCYLNTCIFLWGIFAIYMHIQGILLPKHTYIYFEVFLLYTCISKVFSLPKHTYIFCEVWLPYELVLVLFKFLGSWVMSHHFLLFSKPFLHHFNYWLVLIVN